jgi:uncharacterized protein YkwD
MPVKTKKIHHKPHKHERRSKRFLKVYAPYIPLLLIVGTGFFISFFSSIQPLNSRVLGYATNTTDSGLLEFTNKARASEGINSLKFNEKLDKAAQAKAEDMAKNNYWSHNTPDGREPWVFIEQTDYQYRKAAENLAFGFINSEGTVNGWMNSPTHRANVMDRELKEVGFGIVNTPDYQGHGEETIVVAMYGTAAEASISTPTASNTLIPTIAASANPKKISFIQSLTGGAMPWSTFAIGIMIGLVIMYFAVHYGTKARRALKRGERFIIHHPLLDITLIAFLVLATILSRTDGVIF